jgi:hypothetical protein
VDEPISSTLQLRRKFNGLKFNKAIHLLIIAIHKLATAIIVQFVTQQQLLWMFLQTHYHQIKTQMKIVLSLKFNQVRYKIGIAIIVQFAVLQLL